jgi:uncharacterized protein YdeI (YjbR/CyaY-like superfamily)
MKPSSSPRKFRAVLETAGTSPHWVLARVPVDLKKAWPDWNHRRVRGIIRAGKKEYAFHTSLLPAKGQGHVMVVHKKILATIGAGPGATVQIQMEPSLAKQTFDEPKELVAALKVDRSLRKWFDALSPSMRKGFCLLVDQAKAAETRKQRAERVAEMVMQAMEGEQVTPPILRAAFARQPLAQVGWEAMTPIQRRNHLLGIFFPGSVEAQAKRTARAVEECLRVARKKNKGRESPSAFDFGDE